MMDTNALILTIVSLLIIIAFAFNGHKQGFIKLAVTLVSMAATVFLSFYVNPYMSKFIEDYTDLPNSKVVAFIISYIIVMIILKITVLSMEMISKIPVLHNINKFIGFVAGLAEGFFVLWFLYLIPMVLVPETFENLMHANKVLLFLYSNNLLFNAIAQFA